MSKLILIATSLVSFVSLAQAEWKIDFSRRQKDMISTEKRLPSYEQPEKTLLEQVTEREAPTEDLVIMNTEKGLVPARVFLKPNQRYRMHVVNINQANRNLSFMMDDFSQHHGTYFGEHVSFEIEPRREGLYEFRCPETGAVGQVVVNSEQPQIESPLESLKLRQPASE